MGRSQNILTRTTSSNGFLWGLLILFIAAVVTIGVVTYKGVRNFVVTGSMLPVQDPAFVDNLQGTPDPLSTPVFTPTVEAPVGPIAKPWDGASRVTVLVMGLDFRDWQKGMGAPRTDTMILLTLDPLTRSAGVLNLPRDLWVNIPGFGYNRINAAYRLGVTNNYPGGGPGLAVETVEQFLGVPIHYYAQIDFYAFEKFIDYIGGVDIEVAEKIKIDPIGKMNTVILQPGKHRLDGPKALAYARARYTEGGDFDRASRQQQVISGIARRVLSLDTLTSLITSAPSLYEEYKSGLNTNLTLDDAISLAWLAKDIDLDTQVKMGVISPPEQVLLFTVTANGERQEVLKPITSKIRLLRDDIFASSISPVMAGADTLGLAKAEGARISIFNGSGTGGLANRTTDYLNSLGVQVVTAGDAEFIYETTVTDYTGNPYTLKYLVELMKIQPTRIRLLYDPASQVDVVVSLGADWANSNPMP